MDATLIIILFISTIVSQLALGQDLEIRAGSGAEKDGSAGQPRTIYGHNMNRIMHFGRKRSFQEPANSPIYDLYRYPYQLTFELEQGKSLQHIPEVLETNSPADLRQALNLVYGVLNMPRQQTLAGEQKSLKLISSDEAAINDDEVANAERAQQSSNAQEDDQQQQQQQQQLLLDQQQQQQQQSKPINLNTRSMQATRNAVYLPKAFVSSLMYNNPRTPLTNSPFGSFNKKADQKEKNLFMHFGRK